MIPTEQFGTSRFSTENVPANQRLDVLREVIGRCITRLEIDPVEPDHMRVDMTLRALPGLGIATARTRTAMRTRRTRELLARGNDDFVVEIARAGSVKVSQLGREISYERDTTLISNAEPKTSECSARAEILALAIPAAALAPMLRDPGAALMSVVPTETGALRVLVGYLDTLRSDSVPVDICQAAASHIHDLIALAFGATPAAAELAHRRGVPAARLHAIKADILTHLAPGLTIEQVASRQGVSVSYVRKLLERAGESFSSFVLRQRLERAYRLLRSPLQRERPISAIAFELGFNDLSYFNRTFRRAFGATPSDVRERARADRADADRADD